MIHDLIRSTIEIRRCFVICSLSLAITTTLPALSQAQAVPDRPPVDGEWSLNFLMDTRPGGETFTVTRALVSPYNAHLSATKESFPVNEDGSISWIAPNCGKFDNDCTYTYPEGTTKGWGKTRVTLKVDGSLNVERTLKLNVHWTATDGLARTDATNGPVWVLTAYSMSPDGDSRIQSYASSHDVPPPTTVPVSYLSVAWTLEPQSIEKEETSPDVIRETTTYAGRRDGRYGTEPMSMPVVYRIEVKQVRHMKIVPRG